MKLTRKLTRKHELTVTTCPCYDPIVFWHTPPCPRWESRHNDSPRPSFMPLSVTAAVDDAMQSLVDVRQQLTGTAMQFTVTADPGRHGGPGDEEAQD